MSETTGDAGIARIAGHLSFLTETKRPAVMCQHGDGKHAAIWRIVDPDYKGSNGETYPVENLACNRHLSRAMSFTCAHGPVTVTRVPV